MHETLAKLAPQQVFLIQGYKITFESLFNELSHQLTLSSFLSPAPEVLGPSFEF